MTITFKPTLAATAVAALASITLVAPAAQASPAGTPPKPPAPPTSKPAKPPIKPPAPTRPSSNDVDRYIRGLNYKPEDVLKYDGEKVSNPVPNQGDMDNGVFRVVSKKVRSIGPKDTDIAITSSNATSAFPGAIVLADRNLVENRPTVVSTDRKPATVTVDLPGLAGQANREVVKNPTRSDVNGAVNTILERWNKDVAPKYPNPAAAMQYDETMAYSETQLKAKFGLSFEIPMAKLDLDFGAIHEGKKQSAVVAFKQVFYTVSVDDPKAPSDMFGNGVSTQTIKDSGIADAKPPAYISSMSYGRQIFVKLETTSKSNEVEAAFKALVRGQGGKIETKYKKILENSSFKAVVYGGSSKEQVKVLTGKVSELKKVIENDATYSRTNPGAPISYTAKFLKDNTQAVINNRAEYVETKVTEYRNGSLRLNHVGGYVGRFKVSWDEISFDPKGKELKTRKEWEGNGKDRTAPFNTVITLPANARNISVFAQAATGLAWEPLRTIMDEKNQPLVKERTITISGTTLQPKGQNKVLAPEVD